ncbi:MAG: bifunctional oligoribonuclease/PAP phosphatase NrnA [Bacteroidales bacterium]|nr:bifunctional oligoribonuclease/PAP phosphatase NrnA [Bacteroidales bacterium]
MSKQLFLSKFKDFVSQYKRVVIVSHVNPDGDAIGSSLAFCYFLLKLGLDVKVIIPNDFPSFLSWMPGIEDILVYDKNPDKGVEYLNAAELICYLDFNHPSRTGLIHNALCHCTKTPKLLIDHHRDADYSQFVAYMSEVETSSTSELVAELIQYHGFDKYLDDRIATCLLVGIMTDTGSFAHSIYHPETFEICGKLISSNVNYQLIHSKIYNTFSENRLRLLGYCISNRMTTLDEYHTAYIYLTKSDLETYNYQVGDTEGVVNFPLMIDNIKMAVLITERQGVIRFSFRSKGDFSVHEFAKDHFNGGGHTNAAGGTLDCSIEQAIKQFLDVLPQYKALLNKC